LQLGCHQSSPEIFLNLIFKILKKVKRSLNIFFLHHRIIFYNSIKKS
jgi:hypothetical protein